MEREGLLWSIANSNMEIRPCDINFSKQYKLPDPAEIPTRKDQILFRH